MTERLESELRDSALKLDAERTQETRDEYRLGILLHEQARLIELKKHLEAGHPLAQIDVHCSAHGGSYGIVSIEGLGSERTSDFRTVEEVIEAATVRWQTLFHEVNIWSQDGAIILI